MSEADISNTNVVPNGQGEPFIPLPVDTIDWHNVGVGVQREVSGHIQSVWNTKTQQWSEPTFMHDPHLVIHGLASGLNYGMQAFEGMKAVRDSLGQIRLFRPYLHAARMQSSCEAVCIPVIPQDHFVRCVSLSVALNGDFVPPFNAPAALYVRPMVFGSGPQLNIIPSEEYTFCVYVLPTASLLGNAAPASALVMEDFDRAATRGTGSAKIGGNYAPVMRWQRKAKEDGFGLLLHLDSRTQTEIEEFSACGFIGVHKKEPIGAAEDSKYTLVVPDSHNVIKSVVSASCIELARSLGWDVQVRQVKYDELQSFSEVLAVGTAAIIVSVGSITRKSTGDIFQYGPGSKEQDRTDDCAKVLFDKILASQQGLGEFGPHWATVIQSPASYWGPGN